MQYQRLILSMFLLLASVAKAGPEDFAENHPCKDDREKFCPGQHWHDGLADCLKTHTKEIQAACRDKLSSWEKSHTCETEQEKLCKGVKWGPALGKCLQEHQSNPSMTEDCRARLKNKK